MRFLNGALALVAAMAFASGASEAHAMRYSVAVLPGLGGTSSAAASINDAGWAAGRSNLPGNARRHAVLWRHGSLTDLGTLGGPNSAVLWPVKDTRGVLAGIAQTGEPDPLHEQWSCSAFFPPATGSGYRCMGFRWRAGVMRALPTLGGTNGFATGANDRGEIVGWAENRVRDPTCVPPQVLQFRAVIWGPGPRMRELPPLPGDTVSAATALDRRGRVVGISGYCDQAVGRFSAIHGVLWHRGRPLSIGTLGGVAWNTPMSISQHGVVVGFSNRSAADGGAFDPRAFAWTRRAGIRSLGTLPGDDTSQALGINGRGEIVGAVLRRRRHVPRAVVWRDGGIRDLNALTGDSHVRLTSADDIDDRGRIAGQAVDPVTGAAVAYVACPTSVDGRAR